MSKRENGEAGSGVVYVDREPLDAPLGAALPDEPTRTQVIEAARVVSEFRVLPPEARAQLLTQHLAQAEADLFASELQLLRMQANVEEGRAQMKRLRDLAGEFA